MKGLQTFGAFMIWNLLFLVQIKESTAQSYRQQRCSNRLENALEHMRRRSMQVVKTSRSLNEQQTPYTLYQTFYGQNEEPEDDFYSGDRGYFAKNIQQNNRSPFASLERFEEVAKGANQRQPHKLTVSRVEVEDLRVRLPPKPTARWVEVDKCKFSTENSTLDTRLVFPDLTISGKVVLQPTGGKCNMILRLRHAGIEFRTIPIGFEANNEESRRIGAASVRTDSHFAEPGFISVFAHGCQGPTGIKLRQNSKRRFGFVGEQQAPPAVPDIELSEPQIVLGTANTNRWGKYHNPYLYDIRSGGKTPQHPNAHLRDQDLSWNSDASVDGRDFYDDGGDNFYRRHFRYKRDASKRRRYRSVVADQMNFSDDILNVGDDLQDLVQPDARAFAEIFGGSDAVSGNLFSATGEQDEVGDALTNELEKLFSMGVRGLLTTYMQRALQPAIKETLMENMGYTLSYG